MKHYPKATRTFNGKVYRLGTTVSYKKMAEQIAARNRREDGSLCRVVKAEDGWSVYYRRGDK